MPSTTENPANKLLAKPTVAVSSKKRTNTKSVLAKQFIVWHWVSSAICLGAMLFFAVTGITLNHASSLGGKPAVSVISGQLPTELFQSIAVLEPNDAESSGAEGSADEVASDAQTVDEIQEGKKPLPKEIVQWLRRNMGIRSTKQLPDWSEEEIYWSLPRPGGDAWLTIDRTNGEVNYETTYQGAFAYINDLHKGRHTGDVWFWFIDIFSVACVVFCLTGLGLLWVHAKRRPSTWPIVIAGLIVPILIVVFFVHS